MKSIPSSLERALRQRVVNLNSAITKVSEAGKGEQYARSAFAGGDRSFFDSEAAIKSHYDAIRSEARERGLSEMNALLDDMKHSVDCGLRINTVKAAEVQAAIPLIRDDAALLRFVSEVERRDDYTVLAAAAQYTGAGGKASPTARGLRARLDDYETSLSEVLRKTERFITKALNGDSVCASGWSEWITDNIEAAKDSYERLEAAINGEKVQVSIMDALEQHMAKA